VPAEDLGYEAAELLSLVTAGEENFGTQPSKDQSILQQVKNTTSSNLMETLS